MIDNFIAYITSTALSVKNSAIFNATIVWLIKEKENIAKWSKFFFIVMPKDNIMGTNNFLGVYKYELTKFVFFTGVTMLHSIFTLCS